MAVLAMIWYLEHGLREPLTRIFSPIIKDVTPLFVGVVHLCRRHKRKQLSRGKLADVRQVRREAVQHAKQGKKILRQSRQIPFRFLFSRKKLQFARVKQICGSATTSFGESDSRLGDWMGLFSRGYEDLGSLEEEFAAAFADSYDEVLDPLLVKLLEAVEATENVMRETLPTRARA